MNYYTISRDTSDLHAERFVALLKSTHGEELEGVDVVPEVDADPLPDVEAASGHKVLADDLVEGSVAGARVDQQLTVQREA
jgi:hypothetical protein